MNVRRFAPRTLPNVANVRTWLQMRIYNAHRLELDNVGVVREHIPISRRSLVRKLLQKFPFFQHNQLLGLVINSHLHSIGDVTVHGVDAVIQRQSRPYSLLLKDLYDPLNPDKDTVSIRSNVNVNTLQHEGELMNHMRPLLDRARYKPIRKSDVHRLASYIELPERGLQVRVELEDYSIVEIWHKGEVKGLHAKLEARGRQDLSILKELEAQYYDGLDNIRRSITKQIQKVAAWILKATPMDDDLFYQRVVVILRKKDKKKILMKSFKFVPRGSLQVLFPENQKRMGALNSLIMYGTLMGSGSSVAWNYFNNTTVHAEFMLPIGIVLYRFYYNYDYRKKRYDATIAQLLYENNLSNNIGVVHEIIDRAESERFTSSIILYTALLHEATIANAVTKPFQSICVGQIDDKVERWIGEFSRMAKLHDFDERGAIHNLQKIQLITIDESHKVYVKPLEEAIEVLRQQLTQRGTGVYELQGNAEWNSLITKGPFSADYH